MVWMALTLVTLTAFAGLGLEYGRWNRLVAGSRRPPMPPHWPEPSSCPRTSRKAFATAKSAAKNNGFDRRRSRCRDDPARANCPTSSRSRSRCRQESVGPTRQLQLDDHRPQRGCRVPAPAEPREPRRTPTATTRCRSETPVLGERLRARRPPRATATRSSGRTDCRRVCTPTTARLEQGLRGKGYYYGIEVPAGSVGALDVRSGIPRSCTTGPTCTDGDARSTT